MRRKTRNFFLGKIGIGSDHPVSIQTMCNTRTADVEATLAQISRAADAGCDIIRLSADSPADVAALKIICGKSSLPVVADIQFSGEAALGAIDSGCAGIRVNPGIIHDEKLLSEIARAAIANNTVIRVGANAGSLKLHNTDEAKKEAQYTSHEDFFARKLCDAVEEQVRILEKYGVTNIKAAVKSSEIAVTLKAYRLLASRCDLPLHLGLTEAGTPAKGVLRSAIAVGALLSEGIGDTIRISLTAEPEAEIAAAIKILDACGIGKNSVEIISCPTCGRTEVDLIGLAEKVDALISEMQKNGTDISARRIAVMGCPVNGPGEARNADLGIAGSRNGQLVVFQKGQVIGAYPEAEAFRIFSNLLSVSGCTVSNSG